MVGENVDLAEKYYNTTVTEIFEIQPALWIFRVKPDKGLENYRPGQYTTLGLGIWEAPVKEQGMESLKPGDEKKLLRRAYSMSHPILDSKTGRLFDPKNLDFYEFYVALVLSDSKEPTSPKLTPRLFTLKKGNRLSCGPKVTGHYNLEGVQETSQVVFFSTGTGEAPHNAMIWELLRKGHKGGIVHCVCTRYRIDQAYRATHEKLAKSFPNYQTIYLATREEDEPKLYCQDLIQKGLFEKKTGLKLDAANTHVFLCGNPSMIGRPEEVDGNKVYPKPVGIIEILEGLRFTMATPTQKGNIHFEAYW